MLKWLFKPVKKIGQEDVLVQEKEEVPQPTNIVQQILNIGDIDTMCTDIVKSRVLLCMNTESMEQLFTYMVQQKDITNHSMTAVSLGLYFRGMRLTPTDCLKRLSDYIEQGNRIPGKLHEDLTTLYEELLKLKSI